MTLIKNVFLIVVRQCRTFSGTMTCVVPYPSRSTKNLPPILLYWIQPANVTFWPTSLARNSPQLWLRRATKRFVALLATGDTGEPANEIQSSKIKSETQTIWFAARKEISLTKVRICGGSDRHIVWQVVFFFTLRGIFFCTIWEAASII